MRVCGTALGNVPGSARAVLRTDTRRGLDWTKAQRAAHADGVSDALHHDRYPAPPRLFLAP